MSSDRPVGEPIGRGWTPPAPPPDDLLGIAEEAEDTALGALFSDPEPQPADVPAAAEHSSSGGLGGLFGDVGPAPVAAPQGDSPASSTEMSVDRGHHQTESGATTPGGDTRAPAPRIRRKPLPQQFASVPSRKDAPAGEPVDNASRRDPRSGTANHDDAESAGSEVPEAERSSPGGPGREPSNRPATPEPDQRAFEASASTTRRDTPTSWTGNETVRPAGDAVGNERRSSPRDEQESERIWNLVDQTLAVISADPTLQRIAGGLELTQDLELHRRQHEELMAALRPRMANAGVAISGPDDIEKIVNRVHDELTGISVLGDLWRDGDVDEIMVDRWDIISVERRGRLERTNLRFRNSQHAESTARVLALKVSDRAVSRSIPLVTAELPSARVSFAFGSVVKGGLSVTIRKFKKLLGLQELLAYGSLNEEMVDFLRDAVKARGSILVSGGTGTGKTTIVNMLSAFIPHDERVITIEDAFELKLANTHVVSLQTKEASSLDDTVSVTLADLLRNTLRMRPDRIVVGEIREGEGAMVMLAAASTGHDGTITTIHANSPESAMNERLPDLVRQERAGRDDGAILRSVAGAFDLVVQVTRGRSGRRFISHISAVVGVDENQKVISMDPIFVGTDAVDGVHFTRWPLRRDTDLAERMIQRGVHRWTES